jgi:phage baseplate assembly protein W
MSDPNALVLFGRADGSSDARVVTEIRAALETRPGELPWAPGFGCDLQQYVGRPATAPVIAEIRWRITEAMRRQVPSATVRHVDIEVARLEEGRIARYEGVPLAESALLGLGSLAALVIRIDLATEQGARTIRTTITP